MRPNCSCGWRCASGSSITTVTWNSSGKNASCSDAASASVWASRASACAVGSAGPAGSSVRGPVPLPTEKHRYTVIRSPHKYKDSREHFEMRIHKRLLDIVEHTPKTVDALQRIELPAGVDIEIKIQTA